jgi:hypothetical protein
MLSSGWYDTTHKQDGCANAYADAVNKNSAKRYRSCGVDFDGLMLLLMVSSSPLSWIRARVAMISSQQANKLGLAGSVGSSGGGSVQCTMNPNPQPVSMRWSIVNQGLDGVGGFISAPASVITQRLNAIITRDYNIYVSIGQGGSLIYDCKANQVKTGDTLKGTWWPQKD